MKLVKSNNRGPDPQEDTKSDFSVDKSPKWQQEAGKLLKAFSHTPFLPKT
jgi:hypothetical protein